MKFKGAMLITAPLVGVFSAGAFGQSIGSIYSNDFGTIAEKATRDGSSRGNCASSSSLNVGI